MIQKVLFLVLALALVCAGLFLYKSDSMEDVVSWVEPVLPIFSSSALGIDPNVRYELLDLLKTKRFSDLDQQLNGYEQQLEQAQISEFDLEYIYLGFRLIDPALDALFNQWAASTNSWSSKYAYASYLYAMAWEWRGNAFRSQVPQLNVNNFGALLSQAESLVVVLNSEDRKSAVAMSFRIAIANDGGTESDAELISDALVRFPKSESIYRAAIRANKKNWGGDEFARAKLIHDLDIILSGSKGENASGLIDYYNAQDASKNRNYITAIGDYKTAIQYNPDVTEYYLGLAKAYLSSDQFDAALAAADMVVASWPSSVNARLTRAKILLELEDPKGAKRDMDLALSVSPYDADLNKFAAELHANLGDKEQARKALERATYFKQEDPESWGRLAYVAKNELKDLALAENYYKKALQLRPYDVSGAYGLSTIYGELESCNIVQALHDYMTGCQLEVGKSDFWCDARYINWAYSSVNHLQGHKKCPEINEFDFTMFKQT